MRKILLALIIGIVQVITGCAYHGYECPGFIPGGYYNVYSNSNAVILYKRPSSKFGCWVMPTGCWDCVHKS